MVGSVHYGRFQQACPLPSSAVGEAFALQHALQTVVRQGSPLWQMFDVLVKVTPWCTFMLPALAASSHTWLLTQAPRSRLWIDSKVFAVHTARARETPATLVHSILAQPKSARMEFALAALAAAAERAVADAVVQRPTGRLGRLKLCVPVRGSGCEWLTEL